MKRLWINVHLLFGQVIIFLAWMFLLGKVGLRFLCEEIHDLFRRKR